ncbi:hypothetical protein GCM10009810_07140 [Nostocoides vanveenii]|uniref:Uncharacterized protein n=1 Tax=Nostocoides vanveenii TaxID=330835 RepID=A0ABP4W8J5_9MICO
MEFSDGTLLLGQSRVDFRPYRAGEVFAEGEVRVQIDDCLLDNMNGQERQVTQFVLPRAAEVVLEHIATSTLDLGVDHAAGAAYLVAAITEQHSLVDGHEKLPGDGHEAARRRS